MRACACGCSRLREIEFVCVRECAFVYIRISTHTHGYIGGVRVFCLACVCLRVCMLRACVRTTNA
jgi:hypothetical protein